MWQYRYFESGFFYLSTMHTITYITAVGLQTCSSGSPSCLGGPWSLLVRTGYVGLCSVSNAT